MVCLNSSRKPHSPFYRFPIFPWRKIRTKQLYCRGKSAIYFSCKQNIWMNCFSFTGITALKLTPNQAAKQKFSIILH